MKKKSGIRKLCYLYLEKNHLGLQVLGYQWVNGLDQIREACTTLVTLQPYAICKTLRELADHIEHADKTERTKREPIPNLGVPACKATPNTTNTVESGERKDE